MVKYTLFFRPDLCIHCHACEMACKQENSIPVGPKWISSEIVGPKEVDGILRTRFVSIRCMHCGRPPCADACPELAITKRPDGIVLINQELCTGCKACIEACPFSAPQFNPYKNVVEKCTLCASRIDNGLKPSCVQHCPTKALCFGDINEITLSICRKQHAERTFL